MRTRLYQVKRTEKNKKKATLWSDSDPLVSVPLLPRESTPSPQREYPFSNASVPRFYPECTPLLSRVYPFSQQSFPSSTSSDDRPQNKYQSTSLSMVLCVLCLLPYIAYFIPGTLYTLFMVPYILYLWYRVYLWYLTAQVKVS